MASGDSSVILGSGIIETYSIFTKIDAFEEMISWAAVGRHYSMYLTKSGRVFLHHREIKERIEVELQNRALSVFGGAFYGGIIDDDGCAYFMDEDDPRKTPKRYEFPSPAVELVCNKDFKAVLLSDYKVYGDGKLNNDRDDFVQVSSLSGYKITKISGQAFSCLALSDEGLVFAYGNNSYGQFGDGTTAENYSGFVQMKIPGNGKIKDIAVCGHSLLLSRNGKLFGCGWNSNNQLFHKSENVLKVLQIDLNKRFSNIFVGDSCLIVISGVRIQENPAKSKFINHMSDILQTRFDLTNQNVLETRKQISDRLILINQNNDALTKKISQEIIETKQKIDQQAHIIERKIMASNDTFNNMLLRWSKYNELKLTNLEKQISALNKQNMINHSVIERKIDQKSDVMINKILEQNENLKLKIVQLRGHLSTTNMQIAEMNNQMVQMEKDFLEAMEKRDQKISKLENTLETTNKNVEKLINLFLEEKEESKRQNQIHQQQMNCFIESLCRNVTTIIDTK